MAGRRDGNDENNAQEHAAPAVGPWVEALLQHARAVAMRVQLTPELQILDVSGALAELGQVEEAALRREPALLLRMVHPDDLEVFLAATRAATASTVVVRWQRSEGSLWTEHAIQPWSEAAGASGFAVLVRDVSERRQALQELERVRRDSAYFHTLIHTVNDGILVNAVDGAIEFVNSQLAGLLRATPEEMVGHYIFDYMDDESAAAAKENLRRRREGAEDQFDFRWQRKDGSAFWSIVAAKPLYDERGQHRGSLVAVTDITRRKQAEDELLRARDELEQRVTERTEALNTEVAERRRAESEAQAASQTKSLFLANMSHELRTPLNAIIGYSEMLLEEAEDEGDDAQAADLRKIRGAGKHLLGLIDDVLDLSKIEAGQMELAPEELDIEALVADVATVARPLVEKRRNQLIVDAKGAAARGPFFGDPMKLRQVLLNLLANAAKFTESGTIRLEVLREKGTLRFVVMDTGIGMDVVQRSRLFSAYSQADPAISRTYGGTGLGLAICRRYLDLMNGDIQVVSAPGQGSTFIVVLPDGH